MADNIDAKLPDNDDTSSFQVKDSSDTVLMKVQSGGNVGIGTTSPQGLLQVNSEAGSHPNIFISDGDCSHGMTDLVPADVAGKISTARGADGGIQISGFNDDGAHRGVTIAGFLGSENPPDAVEAIRITGKKLSGTYYQALGDNETIVNISNDTTPKVTVKGNGNVGFGTTSPTYPLEMGSGAYVTAGGVWTNASSRDFKEDISELSIDEAFTALKGLTPTKYRYKTDHEEKHLGFIAEDVPELVASKDRKGLSPMDFIAILTKVVQKQQKEIEALKIILNGRQ
jgi:hypothetical protein